MPEPIFFLPRARLWSLAAMVWAGLSACAQAPLAPPEQALAKSPELVPVATAPVAAPVATASPLPPLLSGARWLRHAEQELLPFWQSNAAQGTPVGHFPTWRCNDGSLPDPKQACAELAQAPAWVQAERDRFYVRMQARQVFTYGMAFHLTGQRQWLALMQAGSNDLRQRALSASGSAVTYFDAQGQAQPAEALRTTQDLAYAGLALATHYYLTADPAVLRDLDRLHQHIMQRLDPQTRHLRWTAAGPDAQRQELVAQLDPMNAYMVLVTPLLQGEQQKRWQADMRLLVRALRTDFCATGAPRCWGTLGTEKSTQAGARHNDFGHSAKTYWMSLLASQILQDPELGRWAQQQGQALLAQAFRPQAGAWAARWKEQGLDEGGEWWIYAELDQLSAALALDESAENPEHSQRLRRTWPYWLDHFVDRSSGEVWAKLNPAGEALPGQLKQHHWKNGYHSMEHALVSYITAQGLRQAPVTLFFARPANSALPWQPYLFHGQVRSKLALAPPNAVQKVEFVLNRPQWQP